MEEINHYMLPATLVGMTMAMDTEQSTKNKMEIMVTLILLVMGTLIFTTLTKTNKNSLLELT
jgi:hypothetical protein